ncbi:MAG: 50S ribosomal protein L23 [Bacteroidetes bacterium]|jgi:large subunit ribosomal protein L23|nr:50S ribosomal protein L23 [Bacteroidota bacterium]HMT36179.1 50S ribosomal protein L23 [Chitinophagaceae bacterium]MBK6821303.1 50S ribosomal protein L23 [Bacteroidota bacterium]MBK7040224.1 50S ribosomal protein L23 [Bacteroidota bacterium]MBK8330423.1 50S ribosomal protein L23 [Bacteroidota bacterium]
MKASEILKKPIVTEKVNKQTEKLNRYCFVVDKRANKLEIKKAVEEYYNVRVDDVNTCVVPAKNKSRMTKAGILKGRKPSFKKATIQLAAGETIDLYAF